MKKEDHRVAVVLLILISAIAVCSERGRAFFGRWSFTKSVDVVAAGNERARYYRLKVGLLYKGEPLEFDIVVGCNVQVTTYKDNDRSVEVGVAPMAFGLKMKDGHGVVVRPPEACQGETTDNGKVPTTLLPLVVTYADADKPWFGIAYVSEDAYKSPLSDLKFLGATISSATRSEWQEWRLTVAPKNFVTYSLLGMNERNRWEKVVWKPGYRAMGSGCTAFSRVTLPQIVRDAIRPFWPADKPDYWYGNEAVNHAFYVAGDYDGQKILFEGNPLRYNFPPEPGFFPGLPRRQPGALIFYRKNVVGDIYPAESDRSLNRLDSAGELSEQIKAKSKISWAEATIAPELNGFAYCDIVDIVAEIPIAITNPRDGFVNRINGKEISQQLMRVTTNFGYSFERDEYVYFYNRYSLVNIFGGL